MRKVYDKVIGFRARKTALKIIKEYKDKHPNLKNRSQAINAIIEAYGRICNLCKGHNNNGEAHS